LFAQRHEREIKQKLEQQEETALNITETYNSLQQEVEIKTKKLKKVCKSLWVTVHTMLLATTYISFNSCLRLYARVNKVQVSFGVQCLYTCISIKVVQWLSGRALDL